MAYFNWGPDLVIDSGPIDEDHRTLVGLVNELHTATSDGVGQSVVADIMARLVSTTQAHLQREEQAMRQAHFPQFNQHQAGHAAFIGKLHELQRKHADGSVTVAAQLSTLLRDWLSLHIRRSDKGLSAYLGPAGAAAPGSRRE